MKNAFPATTTDCNWYWLVDGLQEQGRNVKLGNPARMRQYEGIKATNDLMDAEWLAEQLRLGIFPECYIYPKDVRPVRDALRRRQLFVRHRIPSWRERKQRKSGAVKAQKELACKLAKAMWHVMNGEEYNGQMLFG